MSHRYAFSTKGVLRQFEWNLLREYLLSRDLFLGQQFLEEDECDVEALGAAIQNLPPDKRIEVEQDFQDIYDLADDEGQRVIYQEAKARGRNLTDVLTALESSYDAALWLLLEWPELFADLVRFRAADTLNSRYWRRRFIGKDLHPSTGAAVIKRLSNELTAYLLREEGRGSHCQVEHFERATGTLFLAYPEDFGTTVLEYEGNELIRRKIRPASDLLFFYCPDTGNLEVFCQGTKKKVRDLQQLFGIVAMGMNLPPDGGPATIYDLNRLKDESFEFYIDPLTGLENIEVKLVSVRDRDGGRSVTVEVGGPPGRGVLSVASRYWSVIPGEATDKYPFFLMDVERVKLQAQFRPIGKKRRGRTKTFTLARNGCLLDHEGIDGIIRKALTESNLERVIGELVGV